MTITDTIRQANPVPAAAVTDWQRTRQELLWADIDHRRKEPCVGLRCAPVRPRTRRVGLATAAVILCVAVVSAVLLVHQKNPQYTFTTAAAAASLPGPELEDSGRIWLSGETASATAAARDFVETTLGWVNPEIEPETTEPGPTWVNVTNRREVIRMLLAPTSTNQWQLLQVGTDPDMTRVSISAATTAVTLGLIPEGTETVTLIASTSEGTTKVTIAQPSVDSSIEVSGPAQSILALYFDSEGELIDARGSHR